MLQFRALSIALAALLLLSAPGLAAEPSGLSSYSAAQTIEVLTSDEDGATRETTIWIVVVDGAAYIRTGGTSWGENVQRSSRLEIRHGGSTQVFGIFFVEKDEERTPIEDAFREKYGFQDKLVGWFRGSSRLLIMRLTDAPSIETAP